MKTKTVYITESGIPLINPNDGFILYGCVLKGDNEGGLFGGSREMDIFSQIGIEPTVYTTEEFIKGLGIEPLELKRIAESMMPHTKGGVFGVDV